MRIVFCAAEAAPFAKVGGLGDVVGSLPKALAELGGLQPVVVLPRYGCIDPGEYSLEKLPLRFQVLVLGQSHTVEVWQTTLPNAPQVPVFLLENETYFASRKTVYPAGKPALEIEGFLLLSKALFPLLKHLNLQPDILHLHDWHTAPAAIDLLEYRQHDSFFAQTRSVLTLHNAAYQGFYQGVNWLKEGARCADYVTAVSPTYAEEIQTSEAGCGLEPIFQEKKDRLTGILNGIDTTLLNPETDAFIPETYNRETVQAGKAVCKQVLQQELGLPIRPEVPVFGMVSRLVEQKGLDLILSVIDSLASRPAQWIFLGAGEAAYESLVSDLNQRYPTIRTYLGFNLALAQKIYAGADCFLMPSRFEPCGLGQMIALRYGTIPVVRKTGGLADTIIDIRDDYNLGNGFSFTPYEPTALLETVDAAISYYQDRTAWQKLLNNAMAEDFSWQRSAKQYREVYNKVKQFQTSFV